MNRNRLFLVIVTLAALMLMSTSAVAVVDNADSLYVGPAESYTLGGAHSYNLLVKVAATGTLNVTSYNGGASTGFLELNAPTIEILGLVNGNNRGFRTAEGPGRGNYPGSGASYGGQGGASGWNTTARPPYGTADGPDIERGSGGASQTLGVGGRGGAMVALYASSCNVSGQITVDGAQGSDVSGWGDGGGGGSGGGMLINATNTTVSGTLSANGGRGGNSVQRRGGGGGGGGRIKVFYCSLDFTGTHTETGGILGVGGWPANGYPGSDGTYHSERLTDPVITAIVDVGNDQGRQVRITWDPACLDDPSDPDPVTHYTIWRRIDALPEAVSKQQVYPRLAYPPGNWDFVLDVPARGEDQYNAVVPTLADSTIVAGMHWSWFFVSGVTEDPFVYYDSDPDSGYSLDNLAPAVPEAFGIAYNAGSNVLSWDVCPDEDFEHFRIYRRDNPDLVIPPPVDYDWSLVHSTVGTDWTDTSDPAWRYRYQITAVDYSGNESDPASAETVTGVTGAQMPKTVALYQNSPNPFNPTTVIRYDVPTRSGRVSLRIYDVSGQLIRTLVDGTVTQGHKSATWDGKNDQGNQVGTGVYLYRLIAGNTTLTKKMVLLK